MGGFVVYAEPVGRSERKPYWMSRAEIMPYCPAWATFRFSVLRVVAGMAQAQAVAIVVCPQLRFAEREFHRTECPAWRISIEIVDP